MHILMINDQLTGRYFSRSLKRLNGPIPNYTKFKLEKKLAQLERAS